MHIDDNRQLMCAKVIVKMKKLLVDLLDFDFVCQNQF